jgi:hypothetical protein
MDLENTFYIQSYFLKLTEPFMQQYFDYDSSMLFDEIQHCVENSGINYMNIENGIVKVDYLKTFYENEKLYFLNTDYPYKDIADEFPKYFDFEDTNKEGIKDDFHVYICLSYLGYIYYKQKKGLFNNCSLIDNLDLEYNSVLHNSIYPEILSLYKLILESKKYKHKGDKITLTYKQDKIDINTAAWFLDDIEAYFKNRFPDLTLDTINQLLQTTNKAGRKSKDPYVMIMIWGTYQLLKNHHSYFKSEKAKISKEICEFIISYLNHIGAENEFVDTDIKDNLKDMIKRNYVPKWNLPWRNVFSSIKEKQPQSELERLNQPSRKYNLSNL